MSASLSRALVGLLCALLFAPLVASAFPFGGRIYVYHVCHDATIFARLTAPNPGDYVWTMATKTYLFGAPRGVGQWLLGLTGIPFDCLWSRDPIFPVPAISIMMMGSSGSPAGTPLPVPTIGSDGGNGFGGFTMDPTLTPTLPGTTPTPGPGGVGGVLISEVYYDPNMQHGSDPTHEWVEIYNGSSVSVNLSGWTVQNSSLTDVIPSGTTLAPNEVLLVAQTAAIRDFWNIPSDVTIVAFGNPIGSGLVNAGDIVRLRDSNGTIVDAVSWGTNTSAFSPSVPVVVDGHSITRETLAQDTNTATDWIDRATPTPGL